MSPGREHGQNRVCWENQLLQDGHGRARSSSDSPLYSVQADEIPERAVYNRTKENCCYWNSLRLWQSVGAPRNMLLFSRQQSQGHWGINHFGPQRGMLGAAIAPSRQVFGSGSVLKSRSRTEPSMRVGGDLPGQLVREMPSQTSLVGPREPQE